jgi:hypothetical protein
MARVSKSQRTREEIDQQSTWLRGACKKGVVSLSHINKLKKTETDMEMEVETWKVRYEVSQSVEAVRQETHDDVRETHMYIQEEGERA